MPSIIPFSELDNNLSLEGTDFSYHGQDQIAARPGIPYILFDENNIKCKSITFYRTHFTNAVVLKDLEIEGGIFFINCTFDNYLSVNNVKLGSSIRNIKEKSTNASLVLYDCTFHNNSLIIQDKSEFDDRVIINKCIGIRELEFSNNKFNSSVKIERCEIREQFKLDLNITLNEFRIEKNNIKCSVRQNENVYGSLVYLNNDFEKDIFLKEKGISTSLVFNGGVYNDTITIDPIREINSNTQLTIEGATFHKDFIINYYKKENPYVYNRGCRKVHIANNIFNSGLFINDHETKFEDGYSEPVSITIKISNKFEGLLKVSNFDILDLEMSGSNLRGNIFFKNLSFNLLQIEDFNNYNNLQFINCDSSDKNKNSHLIFLNSFFEKTNFINCDLSGFGEYQLSNNNLTQIKSANTKWFGYNSLVINYEGLFENFSAVEENIAIESKILGLKGSDYIQEENASQIRETFRQLKYAMESQGERIEALKFKSSEMKAYHKYLDLSKGNWQDRFILFVGQTNDYGLNWWKPILILIPIMLFIFYPLIIIATNTELFFSAYNYTCTSFIFTFKELLSGVKIIPELFNPTHSLDKMLVDTKYQIGLLAGTFDFLSRIVLYFFLFQIISAFRKFGK